jgi:hypothetical protein
MIWKSLLAFAYQDNDIVFRFIIQYSSLNGFWTLGNKSIFIWEFLKDDILACVETWDLVTEL